MPLHPSTTAQSHIPGDALLVFLAWAVIACIVVLCRRARTIHAKQGRPWPVWAMYLTELFTFIAFGGIVHLVVYIRQRFLHEDDVDDYIPNRRTGQCVDVCAFLIYHMHARICTHTMCVSTPHPYPSCVFPLHPPTHPDLLTFRPSPWPQPGQHDRIQHVVRFPHAPRPTRHHPSRMAAAAVTKPCPGDQSHHAPCSGCLAWSWVVWGGVVGETGKQSCCSQTLGFLACGWEWACWWKQQPQ